jgi:hypothetical protein
MVVRIFFALIRDSRRITPLLIAPASSRRPVSSTVMQQRANAGAGLWDRSVRRGVGDAGTASGAPRGDTKTAGAFVADSDAGAHQSELLSMKAQESVQTRMSLTKR